jgi:hypothetical protein
MLKRKARATKKEACYNENEQIYHARQIYKMSQTIDDLQKSIVVLRRRVEARPVHI